MTLKNFDVYATLPASDIERARAFYRDVLGLEELKSDSEAPMALFRAANNTRIFLYLRGPTTSDHTAISFRVKHIEKVVADLQKKGVRFESYDGNGITTDNGIATVGTDRAAWFKDTEGNILNVYEKVSSSSQRDAGKEIRS